MPLDWIPDDLATDVDNWGFSEKVSGAMKGLTDAGRDLMRPIGQHVAEATESAIRRMPAPISQPEMSVPEVPRFSLGTVEDWLPGLSRPGAPARQETTPTADTAFSLPSVDDFLGRSRQRGVSEVPGSPQAGLAQLPPSAVGQAGAGPADFNAYVRQAAQLRGLDPEQVAAVMGKEGPSGWDAVGRFETGTSYGPLQLHYAGGSNPKAGMGDDFTRDTGVDLRTDRSLAAHQRAVDYALDRLAKTGDYREWYGADNAFPQSRGGKGRFTPINRVPPVRSRTGPPTAGEPGGPPLAPGPVAGAPTPAPSGGLDVGGIAAEYKGQPYVFGGSGGRSTFAPGTPTDCSGFVASIYKNRFGLDLAAHTDASYNQLRKLGAREVGGADARAGDVVYYMGAGTGGAITHHMGIYAGPGKVLDMSTSGQSGVSVRDIGHGGRYVILRDPRVNGAPQAGAATAPPPPIVPTGVAERTGGERVPQQQVDALSRAPASEGKLNPTTQPWNLPFRSGDTAAPYDARGYDEGPREATPGSVGASALAPRLHPNVLAAFRAANGTDPDPYEVDQLASLGYGLG